MQDESTNQTPKHVSNRRRFLASAGALAAGAMLPPATALAASKKYNLSLAAWSMHKLFFAKKIDLLGMVKACRKEFDIGGFEMVNTMFPSPTYNYCRQLMNVAADNEVKLLLIMCDGEGDMAHRDKKQRMQASLNHHKWIDIAAVLGCHSIRCNSGHGKKGDKDAIKRAAESFSALVDYARPYKLNVIIENHGGLSSDPASLISLMKAVDDPRFGTLPDFGNFPADVDRYDAIEKMMPYAKAVSAKCYDFDDKTGLETKIDFARVMKIVTDAGYHSYVGIEYEGSRLDEFTGVRRAKALLEKLAR